MIDNLLLLSWRVWHARNEATHEKPLPAIEGSVNFLRSYLKMLSNISKASTDKFLKGKSPSLDTNSAPYSNSYQGAT
jgi:hypothetical protein